MNRQTAPYPDELARLVAATTHRPGWTFALLDHHTRNRNGGCGLTLRITVKGLDSYDPIADTLTHHDLEVPAMDYTADTWRRWLFDQVLKVETHEAMEWFQVGASRPFAPDHGPGTDPYTVTEREPVRAR